MGNRLSKITTKTGDRGTTGLGIPGRVSKTDLRIVAIGDVDELNSWIGRLAAQVATGGVQSGYALVLETIQHDLFNLGSELACPGMPAIQFDVKQVAYLEGVQAALNEQLPALTEFVLPGGHREAADAFLVRAIARRAERSVWALIEADQHLIKGTPAFRAAPSQLSAELHHGCARYLNRLSDFLFVYARYLNKVGRIPEILWKHNRQPQ